jgi:hypothetical protein
MMPEGKFTGNMPEDETNWQGGAPTASQAPRPGLFQVFFLNQQVLVVHMIHPPGPKHERVNCCQMIFCCFAGILAK